MKGRKEKMGRATLAVKFTARDFEEALETLRELDFSNWELLPKDARAVAPNSICGRRIIRMVSEMAAEKLVYPPAELREIKERENGGCGRWCCDCANFTRLLCYEPQGVRCGICHCMAHMIAANVKAGTRGYLPKDWRDIPTDADGYPTEFDEGGEWIYTPLRGDGSQVAARMPVVLADYYCDCYRSRRSNEKKKELTKAKKVAANDNATLRK